MTDTTRTVASLLHEASETHHRVYRIIDGDDPDWASWYADWLISLSELPSTLGAKFTFGGDLRERMLFGGLTTG